MSVNKFVYCCEFMAIGCEYGHRFLIKFLILLMSSRSAGMSSFISDIGTLGPFSFLMFCLVRDISFVHLF